MKQKDSRMYTVVRFAAKDGDLQAIHELISNSCDAGQCSDIRSSAFSCVVNDSDTWDAHVEAIKALVQKLSPLLPTMREYEANLHVSVDVAIEPEDKGDRPYVPLVFSPILLDQFVQAGIGLEVTSYT